MEAEIFPNFLSIEFYFLSPVSKKIYEKEIVPLVMEKKKKTRDADKTKVGGYTDCFLVSTNNNKVPLHCALALMAARFDVIAWKPLLIVATEHRDPHVSH